MRKCSYTTDLSQSEPSIDASSYSVMHEFNEVFHAGDLTVACKELGALPSVSPSSCLTQYGKLPQGIVARVPRMAAVH